MTVTLTSPVLGQDVGFAYTGPLESWLLNEGYARNHATSLTAAITVTPTAAVLTAGVNAAATVGTTGDVVFGTKDGVRTTVALAAADTAAGAATKIDTALAGLADAVIAASKLQVTSVATGKTAYVAVVGGNAAVLTALGVAVGDQSFGGDGRPVGASNTGVQADTVANDATDADNRELPYFPLTPDKNVTIANDATNLTKAKFPAPGFDVDPGGVDNDPPTDVVLTPATGGTAGGTVVTINGTNLEGVTSVTFGGAAGTALDTSLATRGTDGVIGVTTPVGTAGAKDVVLVDASGNATLVGGFLYV